MQKRRDCEIYADLHKTNLKIYLSPEDAEEELTEGGLHKGYYDGYHIVRMVAYLEEE